MGTITVYRLETKNGIGPYMARHDFEFPQELREILGTHNSYNNRPSPYHDVQGWDGIIDTAEWHFGFLLMDNLIEWFRDCLDYIGTVLFVKEYEVFADEDNFLFGHSQIVFRKV